ncbi:MAG: NAD(P)/FAD-dependent oxidoreductase [Herpetosiphonaceae bacterium]|nr:NAD(P)/FAD-dependent oxidoreductase [Herpetosiphonaceae bacterium]
MTGSHYPTIVIGSGSAGFTVAISLSQLGKQVALIEARAVGGDCTNVGCVPSKTLIHEAGEQHGTQPDAAAVLATVRHKRDDLRDEETQQVKQTEHLTFFHGTARFVGAKQVAVQLDDGSTRELTGDNIVIATGSRPTLPKVDGLPSHRTLTNENIFELPTAPAHLAIIGSGPIGLEMAFAFRDLGTRVSIITNTDRVFNKSPIAASETLDVALRERGIDVYYYALATHYDEISETLRIKTPQGPVELSGVTKVLIAAGRQRNIDTIGLEQTGVKFDPKTGIEVSSHGQTSVAGIYAIGDVTPTSFWTHSANAQGRRVVQRIAFPWLPAFGQEPLYPNATFSDPEVANVGLMPDQIAKKYHPKLIKTLRFELPKTDKGYTEGLTHGFVQVYALRLTGRILGATIVGPRASEMISFFTLAITEGISLYKLFRLVYPYPTLSGAIQKVADQYVRETLPAFHIELLDLARYGAETAWQRLRGGTFEVAAPAVLSASVSP